MNAINYLLSIETKGIKLGFKRTNNLMSACGNPHLGLPVIQVAGTNGKGSVCAMLANILKTANYKTGLFTSPHLNKVNERVRINGNAISNKDINTFIQVYKLNIEAIGATFFETITALAFWYFKKENVDVAIFETGLGGRLDSVTICNPICTIITPISFDHMEILGNTLIEIAMEKAGIMKRGIACISANQKNEVSLTLKKEAIKRGVPIYFVNHNKKTVVNLLGKKQNENAELVVFALKYIKNYKINNAVINKGLKTIKWYGRNQILQNNPLVIFDVAHNYEGLKCFVDDYKSLKILGKSVLVIALYSRKQINDIMPQIEKIFQHIICTETRGRNPMPAEKIHSSFSQKASVSIIKDASFAIKKGLAQLSRKDGMAIVGSHCLGPAVNDIFKISFDNI